MAWSQVLSLIYGWAVFLIKKILDTIDKIRVPYLHANINGIKVFPTIKAPCQIFLLFNSRMISGTKRAAEPEDTLDCFRLNIQKAFNHIPDGDMVAYSIEYPKGFQSHTGWGYGCVQRTVAGR